MVDRTQRVIARGVAGRRWAVVLPVLAALVGCRPAGEGSAASADGKVAAFVSIPPLADFVQRVGDDHVHVSVLLPAGQSPHTYEPTPRQVVRLGEARVFFCTGVPFEKQVVGKIGRAGLKVRIVDLSEGIERRAGDHDGHHEAEDDHGHHHGELDPHVWMNPRLAKRQAETIRRELAALDPAHAEAYAKNCAAFQAELDRVDREIAEALAPLKGRAFYVFHPAFGYFAEAYGLEQVAVETGGREPTARQLAGLVERARREGVRLLFVQPQFAKRGAEYVAREIGGAVVPLDPLAEDYVANLREVAAQIRSALSGEDAATAPQTHARGQPAEEDRHGE